MTKFGTTRPSGYDFSYDPSEMWRDKAACIGEDPTIFFRLALDDPGLEYLKEKSNPHRLLKYLEKKNFARAQKICASCPVRQECGEDGQSLGSAGSAVNAVASDFTVRGGALPNGYTGLHAGRPKKVAGKCVRGHDRPDPKKRCQECRNEKRVRQPRLTIEELHKDIPHVPDWRVNDKTGRKRCQVCNRERRTSWNQRNSRNGKLIIAPSRQERHLKNHPDHEARWGASGTRCLDCDRLQALARKR